MHDLVIRGGTIVDGTGASAFPGDVAIDGDRIAAVGPGSGRGRREIDARGLLVLPGWVDIHTHYDGQAIWDPLLTPSSWHGVTTVVLGNCGVGFAPVRPGAEGFLINLMEGVEDIPGAVLAAGIDFRWESFSQYLDALAGMPRTIDVGTQVPHGALRFYAMGERGADHAEAPSGSEIAAMSGLVAEAIGAGALGFSTSRTHKHKAADGRPTPSRSAGESELLGIARALATAGTGVLECNADFFAPGEFALLRHMVEVSGRPLSVLLLQVDETPDLWRRTLADIRAANRAGLPILGQVGSRAIGVLLGLDATLHPFVGHPAYREVADLPLAARVAHLGQPERRRRLATERPGDDLSQWMGRALARTFELGSPPDYEPDPATSLTARAGAEGRSVYELALDLLLQENGRTLLYHPFENYSAGSLDVVRELLLDEHTVLGLGDAGAHVATVCDASSPTSLITHWARDRVRGPRLPLEFLVRRQTRDAARAVGLLDRGVLAPGYKADLNLIDFAALRLERPELVYDFPAGGRRLVQRARGYRHTFLSGTEVARDDRATGALPGAVVRGTRSAPR
jgi:N-acyl-D-aspartate/D-glutamate deacylase